MVTSINVIPLGLNVVTLSFQSSGHHWNTVELHICVIKYPMFASGDHLITPDSVYSMFELD